MLIFWFYLRNDEEVIKKCRVVPIRSVYKVVRQKIYILACLAFECRVGRRVSRPHITQYIIFTTLQNLSLAGT